MLSHLKKLVPEHSPLRKLYHKGIAVASVLRFRLPARQMNVIGVTGTDGKTTTTFLTMQLLRFAGKKVGMASTVAFQIGDKAIVNVTHKTTLGRFGLQRLLSKMKNENITNVILEVSSHALEQSRVWGIPFKTAVFTNLSREHLDYHRTMEEYFAAKKKLFTTVSKNKVSERTFVLNARDARAKDLLEISADRKILFTQNTEGELLFSKATDSINIMNARVESEGQTFDIIINGKTYHTHTVLVGNFNLDNIAAAVGAAMAEGIAADEIVSYIPQLVAVPGRMEVVDIKKDFTVIIDYAVTPEALKKCYSTLRSSTKGNLIAVLGACGDRDQGKRGVMGDIATTLCDHVLFTDEEPYTEDPMDILHMLESIAKGKCKTNYQVLSDRRKAIREAMKSAKKGDIVVITGMGDQTSRVVGEKKIPWSDREVVHEEQVHI